MKKGSFGDKKLPYRTLVLIIILGLMGKAIIAKAFPFDKPKWNAQWISYPGISGKEFGIYHFRKQFDLETKPEHFKIHVSGDSRYQLYVNGRLVCFGPSKSDITHWKYETIDIAKYLKQGKNTIASSVWNFGKLNPLAIISLQTAFIIQGASDQEQLINTNITWKCFHDPAYQIRKITSEMVRGYYAASPGEILDARKYPWNWEMTGYDDSGWKNAEVICRADLRNERWTGVWPAKWLLEKRSIPFMEIKKQRIRKLRKAVGIEIPEEFPLEKKAFKVAPHSKLVLLLDQTFITTAFPVIEILGGKDAKITLGYSESLFIPGTNKKENRNFIDGKEFIGLSDTFICDGKRRTFKTLDWRSFRYLELSIETADESLEFIDLYSIFTAYPFKLRSEFNAGSKEIDKILEVGWRTARVCAHETYMDTPYYERLQYVGDTRIQGLISIYNSGDTRLLKKAIRQIFNSRLPEGVTYSRYPSNYMQIIPPFSLWWIGMVHDYWMYDPDEKFVKEMLQGVRDVLSFFHSFQAENGSVENLPMWNFMDWNKKWSWGVPVTGSKNRTASIDILLYQAFLWAAELENGIGNKGMAGEYSERAQLMKSAIYKLYFSKEKGLFADTDQKDTFSEQANTLAITSGLVDKDRAKKIIKIMLTDHSLSQCTSYFEYYFNNALRISGNGDLYLHQLKEWKDQLSLGLTTWREAPEPSRSDCHAWSASPNIELYRTVLGIRSGAPGYKKVIIEPYPGALKIVSGKVPHPKGDIVVNIRKLSKNTAIQIVLPPGVNGALIWKGKAYELQGKTKYNFKL